METTLKYASLDNNAQRPDGLPGIATWAPQTRLSRLISRLRRLYRWYWRAFHRAAGSDLENVYCREISQRK